MTSGGQRPRGSSGDPYPRCGSAVACARVLRAASELATAGPGLPDPSGECWHRVQKVLEALPAHEQNLGIGRDDSDAGLASGAFHQAHFSEDVALAQFAGKPALGPDCEVTRQKDVEPIGPVLLDEDVMTLLELLDQAEDGEAGELSRVHVLDDAPSPRVQRRLESGALLSELQPLKQASDLVDPLLDHRVLPDQPVVLLFAEPDRLGGAVGHDVGGAETVLMADAPLTEGVAPGQRRDDTTAITHAHPSVGDDLEVHGFPGGNRPFPNDDLFRKVGDDVRAVEQRLES